MSERRVLVVDDSAFMRRVLRDLIDAMPGFTTCAAVRDADEAMHAVRTLDPDLVTLDVELPGTDGLSVLAWLMAEAPRPVVMVSGAASADGMTTVLRALELGAVEFVRKPSGPISLDLATVADALERALQAAAASRVAPARRVGADANVAVRAPSTAALAVLVIAASTGGPAALMQVVPALPATLEAAVVIVQHMPAGFTTTFAERLDRASALRVREADEGMRLECGTVLVAPGDRHVRIGTDAAGRSCARLGDDAPRWGVRPAADLLFESAAAVIGGAAIGVVLTGMGEDGAAGLRAIQRAGGQCLAQDAATAVVDGMPAAARRAVRCDAVSPLDQMAATIIEAVRRVRGVPHAA